MSVLEKFLRYAAIDTQSDETTGTHPSTEKQKDLGRLLTAELKELGAADVVYDEEHNYVYAKIPATDGGKRRKVLGFLAHMDTSPETSGKNVKPQLVPDYDGGCVLLNESMGLVLSPEQFPELKRYVGQTLITTDGTSLLGADDKAGVAEIMTMAECLLKDAAGGAPQYRHGPIAICFTTDEEIGEGVSGIDLEQFGADYAYTVDGGELGELEYENFNAAAATVTFKGLTVHPGEAKGKMKNAAAIATAFHDALPKDQVPEKTEGYEGFIYLMEMTGTTESAKLSYIIRDHDRALFDDKKQVMVRAAEDLNRQYGEGTVTLELKDQYYNMKDQVIPDYQFLIDRAKESMEELGIVPIIRPIRGGTDGANLSYMGVPCPNLCAGGHNFHGRFEYCVVESMESIVELLLKLACK